MALLADEVLVVGVAQVVAVVGGDDDDGVVGAAREFELFHEVAEPAVAEGDLAGVVGLDALDFALVEHAAVRCIQGLDDVSDVVVRVVETAVAGGRLPGFVRIERVDDQEEAVSVVVVVEPAGGVVEEAGRVEVGFLATKQVVGEVLGEEVAALMLFGESFRNVTADGVGREGRVRSGSGRFPGRESTATR